MYNVRRDLLAREIQRQCRGKLKRDEPLAKHTTFGLGGTADLFFAPADLSDLTIAVPLIKDAGLPIFRWVGEQIPSCATADSADWSFH